MNVPSVCATNVLDDQVDGWQWVEGVFNFTELGISRDDLMTTMVQVELLANTASTPRNGVVYFDNVCVEPLFARVVGKQVNIYITLLYVCA